METVTSPEESSPRPKADSAETRTNDARKEGHLFFTSARSEKQIQQMQRDTEKRSRRKSGTRGRDVNQRR